MTFDIKSFAPRLRRPSKTTEGAHQLRYHGQFVIVEVFSWAGDEKHRAFTSLKTYVGGKEYHATLPKCYHPRWFGRLAHRFEWQAWQDANRRGAIY